MRSRTSRSVGLVTGLTILAALVGGCGGNSSHAATGSPVAHANGPYLYGLAAIQGRLAARGVRVRGTAPARSAHFSRPLPLQSEHYQSAGGSQFDLLVYGGQNAPLAGRRRIAQALKISNIGPRMVLALNVLAVFDRQGSDAHAIKQVIRKLVPGPL